MRSHWTYQPEQFRESNTPVKRRLVAEQNGEIIATAHLYPFGDGAPDALRLNMSGAGECFTPLYLALLADLPPGFSRLLGVTREDFSEQMHFFHAAAFRNAWQSWGAHLDLTAFDFERFRALDENLFLEGYEVERLSNDTADWNAFYALHQLGVSDVPRNPTTTPENLESEALRVIIQREEAAFIARHKGEMVALTRLTRRENEVESEFTVTHPAHRSKGLATLLKAHALNWATESGYMHAGTGGTVLNLPMLRVNTRLGYVTEQMWVTWERKLDDKPLP